MIHTLIILIKNLLKNPNGLCAEEIVKANLEYFSGYYDEATMYRVQKLFRCSHPIFKNVVEE